MVSLVLLILAPVVLAALILGGIFLSSPKPNTSPNIPKLNITTTSLIPPPPLSSLIFSTRILPAKEQVTPLIPIGVTVNPSVTTTTSKVPDAVTTKVVPNPVTTTKFVSPVTQPIPLPTLTVPSRPSPSPNPDQGDTKDKKTGGDDEKEDEEEDDKEDEFEDEEEEEDETPNINGTTGIQAMKPKDGRKQSAFRMKRSILLKQVASVTDDNDRSAAVDKLKERVDKIVEEQSAPFEAELERIMSELLDSQAASVYSDVLQHVETHRLQRQHEQQQDQQQEQGPTATEDKDDITTNAQKSFRTQDSPPAIDTRALLNTLLQPFIIQFRTDVRNTVIFICNGQHDGLIDGNINGNDDYAKKAAQDDIIATTHPDGVHITDLYDPKTGALALECLTKHFGHLTTALGKLLATRFAGLKEVLLSKVAELVGIPRFLIPLSEDGEERQEFVEQSVVDALSEEEKERIQQSEAFARWLVNSMVNEFQLAVEQDQDINVNVGGGNGSGRGRDARGHVAVAGLPDNDDTNNNTNKEDENDEVAQSEGGPYQRKEGEEKEKIVHAPQAAAREPFQPRIRSRRSTNKKI
ncbi:hypothetical protein BGX24_009906 [Mortierella sp. AD032]|nr:hypothetical protein BGX24_009906 [Mortierella sp. AD032]